MKRQKAGVPKARCEVRLPTDLDLRLDKIAMKAGVTRTSLMIAAIERFVYGEETATGVETIHERVAVLTTGQDKLRSDNAGGKSLPGCRWAEVVRRPARVRQVPDAVEVAKSELMEGAE